MLDLMKDLWEYIKEQKVYWMAPIIVVLACSAAL